MEREGEIGGERGGEGERENGGGGGERGNGERESGGYLNSKTFILQGLYYGLRSVRNLSNNQSLLSY